MTREISRQAFVRGALGAAAGAVLASCRITRPQARRARRRFGHGDNDGASGPRDWAGLDDAIEGRVILPSSADYAAAKTLFNSRFDDSTPAAVVTAKSTDDVQKAVEFAAKNGIKIAARSGGHSYIGASAANGAMVIDLRQLPGDITYDDGPRARDDFGCGRTGFGADRARRAWTIDSLSGSCPTVGVAGLTLGGGLGSDARRSGSDVRRAGVGFRRAAQRRSDHRISGRPRRSVLGVAGRRGRQFRRRHVIHVPNVSGHRQGRRHPGVPRGHDRAGDPRLARVAARRRPSDLGHGQHHGGFGLRGLHHRVGDSGRRRAESEPAISAPRSGCSPSAIRAGRSTAWTSSTTSKAATTQRSRGRSWRDPTSSAR